MPLKDWASRDDHVCFARRAFHRLLGHAARWLESGTLCDRDDRFDYLAALAGLPFPVLGVAAAGDPLGRPAHAWPALDALDHPDVERLALDESWGHLDLVVGQRADTCVLPVVLDYLERFRRGCQRPRGPASDGTAG